MRSPIPFPAAQLQDAQGRSRPYCTMARVGVQLPRQATPTSPVKALFTPLLPGSSSSQKLERNGTHTVPLSPGGTAGKGGSGGQLRRGRCLGLASLEHLLPALHARLLLDILPPVTDIAEVLLLEERWAHRCEWCPWGKNPPRQGPPTQNPMSASGIQSHPCCISFFLACILLFQHRGCQRRKYQAGRT